MRQNKTSILLRLIALFLCVSFIMSKNITTSLAKYTTSKDTGNITSGIAKFIDVSKDITTSGTIIFESITNINPAETKSNVFKISNTGETPIKVVLTVESNNVLPLIFKWNNVEYIDNIYIFDMPIGTSKNITLDIIWDENNIDFSYSNYIDYVVVKATCEQIQ